MRKSSAPLVASILCQSAVFLTGVALGAYGVHTGLGWYHVYGVACMATAGGMWTHPK